MTLIINKFSLVICVLLLVTIKSCYTIDCYQCDGTDPKNPFQCNEWLENDVDLEADSCDNVYDAKFCVKHTGRFEAVQIKCFQCSAGNNLNCSDGMIHMDGFEPTSCDHIFEAQFCIKSTGLSGGIGTKRFCSSKDLGNYCNYVRQPGDTLEFYRTCLYTCNEDGCNAAPLKYSSTLLHILSGTIILFLRV